MKTVLVGILSLALGVGIVGVALAQISPQTPDNHSGGTMGSKMEMMGGGQMGQMMPMMPMMQACTQMMQQMSAMMGQHGTPRPQSP